MPKLLFEPIRGLVDYVEVSCSAVVEALAGGEAVVRLDDKRTAVVLVEDGVLLVCIDHVDKGTIGCWSVRNHSEVAKKCMDLVVTVHG